MNGYVITGSVADAAAVFGVSGVRHVAALDNGEGFVAFDGDQPCAGALLLASDDQDGWWYQVRKVAPTDEVEAFYLLSAEHFAERVSRKTGHITAATRLTSGNVLVSTDGATIDGAIWGARATSFLDVRVPSLV